MNRKFHKTEGNATTLSEAALLDPIPGGISSQSLLVDMSIGRLGGVPLGRITEIAGFESHGKSTLAQHYLAEAQRRGGVAVLADTEKAYDVDRARAIGVDPDTLIVIQPSNMEEMFEMMHYTIGRIPEDVKPVVIVWDSVAATQTAAEEHDSYADVHVGSHARVLSQALRKSTKPLASRGAALICINQMRWKIGGRLGYGADPYKTFGGQAFMHHAMLRLRVKKIATVKEADKKVGIRCKVQVMKNKVAPPHGEGEFTLYFEKGLDRKRDLIDAAVKMRVVEDRQGYIHYKGVKCRRREFFDQIIPLFGSAKNLRRIVLKRALRNKIIKPY